MTADRLINALARHRIIISLALCCWLLMLALVARWNHDESQYVAAAILSLDGLIFRDFMSLQPPMQAWVYAPIPLLFGTHAFIAMRLATASAALITLWATYRAQRLLDVPVGAALASILLMASCSTFQFTASIIRNDMLAAMFAAFGLWAFLRATGKGGGRFHCLLSGLAFGLAAATKLSFVPVAAMAAILALWIWGRHNIASVSAMALGMIMGGLPALASFLTAPAQFLYGVLEFGSTAPFQWYTITGNASELTLFEKAKDIISSLAYGPALLVLVIVVVHWIRRRPWTQTDIILACLLIAALAGAALPTPTHTQYVLPLLPFLFVAFGALAKNAPPRGREVYLLAAFCAIGLLYGAAHYAGALAGNTVTPLTVDRQARWIGDRLHERATSGVIVTMAPEMTIDSGYRFDIRFATGPFIFRSATLISPDKAKRMNVAHPDSLWSDMERHPPTAILMGYEDSWGALPPIDLMLADYAIAHGYEQLSMPDGKGRLFIRPRRN